MPLMPMDDVEHDKSEMLKNVGDLSAVEVFGNHVLVATYKRGEKTKSGLFIPQQNRDEDKYQGKVGLVMKKGPLAFKGGEKYDFGGVDVQVGDWVYYRVSDGWPVTFNTKEGDCRMIPDHEIRGRVSQPDLVF